MSVQLYATLTIAIDNAMKYFGAKEKDPKLRSRIKNIKATLHPDRERFLQLSSEELQLVINLNCLSLLTSPDLS
jgi:hypothetical protein